MKIFLIILFSLLYLFPISSNISYAKERSEEISKQDSLKNELDEFFLHTIEDQNFVALGGCIFKENKIFWEGYYGWANLEEKIPLTKENIFHLASLSKVFTATALIQLYERGKLKLDDDINNYIKFKIRNPHFPEKPVTFRMLLTHTSSLADVLPTGLKKPEGVEYPHGYPGDPEISLSYFTEELFIPGGRFYSAEYFSMDEPGTKYHYSNFSFGLIGYLVEQISGEDFSDYCKENIFNPLGMTNTGWYIKDLDTSKIIYEYGFPPEEDLASYKRRRLYGVPDYPAGNLRTTMDDLLKFISVFMNNDKDNKMLKPESMSLMLTPQSVKDIPSRSFPFIDIGLTWLITEVENEHFITMNGFSGSIFTTAYFSPQNKTAIVYFFTGVSMKNMPAMVEITKKLYHTLKVLEHKI
jgi:CubicO group peptidase (beta-lactamase class C family)